VIKLERHLAVPNNERDISQGRGSVLLMHHVEELACAQPTKPEAGLVILYESASDMISGIRSN
jgi:hypothetical protein